MSVCGTGNWGGPKPGDPDSSGILTATPAFGGIDVSWTLPGVNPHAVAYTRLYRALVDNFDAALILKDVQDNFWHDKHSTPTQYYYWIRFYSINGTEGDLIGPVTAVARPLIADLIEQLTQKIDEGVLSQSLKAKLDEISILNQNLLNEITAREDASVTLAQAIADAEAGIADALNFIHTEINSRATADQAVAEQLDIVASTLGDSVASVSQHMATEISRVDGVITQIGARWTAQVNVNGLVGGFGVYNDGKKVQAGFDVDTFWIGRTNANKRKPFIIEDGEVFIDQAVINELLFTKLRSDDGSLVFANGALRAQYVNVAELVAELATIQSAYIGKGHIKDAAVDTLQIAGNAVTVPLNTAYLGYTPGTGILDFKNVASITLTADAYPIAVVGMFTAGVGYAAGLRSTQYRVLVDGSVLVDYGIITGAYEVFPSFNFLGHVPARSSRTFVVQFAGEDSDVRMAYRSLTLLGVKR